MTLHINGTLIRQKTLWLLGLIAAGSITSQFAAINHFLSYHPRLVPLGGFLLSALAVIHNPKAEAVVAEALSGEGSAAKTP